MVAAKIAVVYSSTWGHIRSLAEAEAEGLKASGAEVELFQFPEIISEEGLAKMHAAPKADYPTITAEKLAEFDGFLFGIPTRYGRAVGAVSAFFDHTGGLWAKGGLIGKFGGIFTSTASQHGGQETTALTTIPFFVHHGISFVPLGYANPILTDNSKLVGGSAYGAAAIANGDGSRAVSAEERELAVYQGKTFGDFVGTYVKGKSAVAATMEAEPVAAAKVVPAAQESEGYAVPADASKAAEKTTEGAVAAPVAAAKPPVDTTPATKDTAKKSGGIFSCCVSDKNFS